MTVDMGIKVFVEIEQIWQDQPKWFPPEERAGVFECDRGGKDLPPMVAITPALLAAPHIFNPAF
jgi:hypothetical protein